MDALVLYVRLHDGRYHGRGDWPPSPARLFQALVAGAGLGSSLSPSDKAALQWLEKQKPPLVAAPLAWRSQRGVCFYVPNNDGDAIGGDPLKVAKIRTDKIFRPYFFDPAVPFVYVWTLSEQQSDNNCAPRDDVYGYAHTICSLAKHLYQLGRGIDMAWAWGEIISKEKLEDYLSTYPGRIYRPSTGRSSTTLPSPCPGSLESLERRHEAFGKRFEYTRAGKALQVTFHQPPKPRFQSILYDSPPSHHLYELRSPAAEASFAPWPLTRVVDLVVGLRDGAVKRLKTALLGKKADIHRALVGRKPDGTNDIPPEDRVRIIPLPSIGHFHADRRIRRVLIEVPPTCPLRAEDVHWAFSGLDVVNVKTGEVQAVLTRSDAEEFLRHYGFEDDGRYRVWRTVTPAALPGNTWRRRIDPARKLDAAKRGNERATEQIHAAAAVRQALRHAGVQARVETLRLQREPFEGNGSCVEPFAEGTRFAKERLWHVEITFGAPVKGPLLLGDGRFCGLGLMSPVRDAVPGVQVFAITADLTGQPDPIEVVRALRRAVMARVQAILGKDKQLPSFFSGHEENGSPVQHTSSSHLSFAFEPTSKRLLIFAPHVVERRAATHQELLHLRTLDAALEGFHELRAGCAGIFSLFPAAIDTGDDPLMGSSCVWETMTPYVVTRHAKEGEAKKALEVDVRTECRRLGLPEPKAVKVNNIQGVPGIGLTGKVKLHFVQHITGPLLLGRTRYLGGGLFLAVHHQDQPYQDQP
jgi:CRISPR-associated protein Csb2